jgi:hypothetical protein
VQEEDALAETPQGAGGGTKLPGPGVALGNPVGQYIARSWTAKSLNGWKVTGPAAVAALLAHKMQRI